MTQYKFKTKLIGHPETDGAGLKPPFDVVEVFQRRGRVPVKGTINGFAFRSSLMNMGDGHMMAVNAQMRAGARCKAGDTVDIVMELDEEKRVVEVPSYLKKAIAIDPKAKEGWERFSFTHQKEWVRAVEDAKKPETRQKRIAAMLAALREKATATSRQKVPTTTRKKKS